MKPFFSIIVVSYNAECFIKKTIESVLCQDFENYEIIVKDAQSTDCTLQNIPISDKIKIYSTKDNGIYDGMNEAIGYASGEYLLFLNCGDFFVDSNVLSQVYDAAKKYNRAVVYGDYIRDGVTYCQPGKMNMFTIYRSALCHQTMFFSKNLFEEFGRYNTKYKIKADYDFTVNTVKAGVEYVHVSVVVSEYMGGGVSEKNKNINVQEEKMIYNTYFSSTQQFKYNTIIFFTFRKIRQCLVSEKSPQWLRKLYRKVVNLVNR